ncbi:MAG: aldose 1-epimerase family protein [Oscillospiraceae bacterium]|nr:aldose 1-epimerase family protein [Oscillospiraceae bacterium]MDE7171579.1 aldose 1-epimerase family protein [Oscillospiraceae bacterium]
MRIELRRGALTAAVETKGGELVSFRDERGTEYIWSGDPKYWPGRNPNLFPIVGNLVDGKVSVDGRSYEMTRHGFARRSEFAVAERGEDYAVLELRDSPETLACYPYHFVLRIRHQLTDSGFYTQFEVQNPGSEDLLFCVGGHTGINCPLREGERFEDYRLVFDEVEDAQSIVPSARGYMSARREHILNHTDTIALDHGVFDRLDTIIFEGLRSKGVTLRHKDGGRGVYMDFGEFPMIAFWTMGGVNAPYICLEPWRGCAAVEGESGEFADKPHAVRLAPGGEKKLRYTVELR